jgi:hypothetical protein
MLKQEEAETDFAAEQLSMPLQVPMLASNTTLLLTPLAIIAASAPAAARRHAHCCTTGA